MAAKKTPRIVTPKKKTEPKTQTGVRPSLWIPLIAALGLLLALVLNASFMSMPPQAKSGFLTPSKHPATESANPVKTASASSSSGQLMLLPQNSGRQVHVPILMYHYIGRNPNPADNARNSLSVDPDLFETQMKYLAKTGYTPITFDTLYAGLMGNAQLPAKPVILTFDDGYIDFYVNAFPILRSLAFHAVSFIPTGLMDSGYYLHWSQIKEMDQTGLISFQAHSVNHINLTILSDDKLRYQLVESKRKLEEELGKPVNFMAYPYGISDPKIWQAVHNAGYIGSVGTWLGLTESEGNLLDMPRLRVGETTNLSKLIL